MKFYIEVIDMMIQKIAGSDLYVLGEVYENMRTKLKLSKGILHKYLLINFTNIQATST